MKYKAIAGLLTLTLLILTGIIFRDNLTVFFSKRPITFIFIAFLSECLFLPRISILIAAGLFFSTLSGTFFTIISDILAGVFLWWIGKSSFSEFINKFSRGKIETFRQSLIISKPATFIALMRIMPLAHYSTVSVISGSADVPFIPYLVGTFLGLIPTALIYTYLADSALRGNHWRIMIAITILVLFVISAFFFTASKKFRTEGKHCEKK
ncbi:MAG: TVP38/TMEM64 family protein [Deltaproteobacteria bacterium]|nr:TVP38/TMEM64 family protein [Deltaproteobacteria bacterium]